MLPLPLPLPLLALVDDEPFFLPLPPPSLSVVLFLLCSGCCFFFLLLPLPLFLPFFEGRAGEAVVDVVVVVDVATTTEPEPEPNALTGPTLRRSRGVSSLTNSRISSSASLQAPPWAGPNLVVEDVGEGEDRLSPRSRPPRGD